MSTIILDKTIDLNSLFSMTYNFDLLKQVLKALILNKDSNDERLKNLELNLQQKENQIKDLNDSIKNQKIYFNEQIYNLENLITNIEIPGTKENEIIERIPSNRLIYKLFYKRKLLLLITKLKLS